MWDSVTFTCLLSASNNGSCCDDYSPTAVFAMRDKFSKLENKLIPIN